MPSFGHVTSYVGIPETLAGKLDAAAVSGEFTVRSTAARRVDDTFPVTDVVLTSAAADGTSYTVASMSGSISSNTPHSMRPTL